MKRIFILILAISCFLCAESKNYTEEQIVFHNGDIKLTGTLSLPSTNAPHPAVILVTGSGAQDRDENIYGFKIFAIIADYLTQNGIAVLRYDDRGVGGSTGNIDATTTQETADDVIQAMQLLKSRQDIDHKKIGILGHSEGGIVAAIVASKSDAAFIVLMAGSTLLGETLLVEQANLMMQSQGIPEEQMAANAKVQSIVLSGIRSGDSAEKLAASLQVQLLENLKQLPLEQQQAINDLDVFAKETAKNVVAGIDNRWFRNFVTYDPGEALVKVKCPVLALFGGLDVQVPADSNSKSLVSALREGKNTNYKIKVFSEANHLFQKAKTGSTTEYQTLEKEFVPGFLEFIDEWLQKTLKNDL